MQASLSVFPTSSHFNENQLFGCFFLSYKGQQYVYLREPISAVSTVITFGYPGRSQPLILLACKRSPAVIPAIHARSHSPEYTS